LDGRVDLSDAAILQRGLNFGDSPSPAASVIARLVPAQVDAGRSAKRLYGERSALKACHSVQNRSLQLRRAATVVVLEDPVVILMACDTRWRLSRRAESHLVLRKDAVNSTVRGAPLANGLAAGTPLRISGQVRRK
jgi:hypothetical protein